MIVGNEMADQGFLTSRRGFLKSAMLGGGAALTLPGVLSACGRGEAAGTAAASLVFAGWGGDYQEAEGEIWLKRFASATGTKVVQDSPADYAKIQSMVASGNVTWDLVEIDNDFGIGDSAALFEPIDYTSLPREELLDGAAWPNRVGLMVYTTVLAYRADKLSSAPQSWADVFDLKRFPGKRALDKRITGSTGLESALIADGVPVGKLYPLDIPRALRKLDTIKESIIWYETTDQGQQLFASGEVTIGHIPNGRIKLMRDAGVDVRAVWNQYGLSGSYLAIPKGAPNAAAAHKLIGHILSAQNNAAMTGRFAYGPVNRKALNQVDSAAKPYLPTTYLESGETYQLNAEWLASNRAAMEQAFQEWLTS
ncbi:extracellular solute-binding protein [Nonomuraea turcica]|uniref:extracellular solute-binding protein n=1 Tax=Nonomuraea sp. G32 TaxID=3067274 RepID=UPI00273CC6E1|nr:extracellular solute-binding protein [Nonomuraea sp. G32]MDP4506956.1 extracellular solute-binding protein [Nonomuraea sp. G32]